MTQELYRRVLLGTVLGCLLVGGFTILGFRLARPLIQHAIIEHRIGGIDFSKCSASPETWGWSSGVISFYAYDESGRSLNPAAPAINNQVLEQAREQGAAFTQNSPDQAVFVYARDATGPCSIIGGTTKTPGGAPIKLIFWVLLGAVLFGVVFAVLATFLLVVRPLRTRIDALSRAAGNVGTESFTPESGTSDSLGYIANVLAESHARIIEAQTALEQRNHALEDHLAGVAHDLRTPLASMHLALEALATESQGAVQQEARRALADAVFLSSMVDNLHLAARLRHEVEATSGRVELSELIRRIEKRFTIVGRHGGIQVAANTPNLEVWVACTPALAERAVANLVQNAVEHNQEGGHVAIKLAVVDGGKRFQLLVIDDGPGMPRETLASLQSESFLLDDARPRGPGMGTLITNEVARRAGWSVHYAQLTPTGLEVRLEGPVVDTIPFS
ncbi:MAG: sensor histidine kinase [Bradymonadia bacterium]